MANKYQVRYLSEAEYPAWDGLVEGSSLGSAYSTTTFLRALCGAVGTRLAVMGVFRGSELHGGVALQYSDSRYGRLVHPRGPVYYNGLVLRDFAAKHPGEAASRNLEMLTTLATELGGPAYGAVTLCNRHPLRDLRPFCWQGWEVTPRYTYEVPITDLEALWQRMDQNARRLIGRCEQQGLLFGESDDFQRFYRLHLATCGRKGIAPYLGQEQFATLFATLKAAGICRLYTASLPDGTPIGTQLVLASRHPVTHTWAAATDPEHMASGASAFLRWHAFRALSEAGYAANDLTDAMNPVVARFKGQLGGDLVPSFLLRRVNSGALRWRQRLDAYVLSRLGAVGRRLAGSGRASSQTTASEEAE